MTTNCSMGIVCAMSVEARALTVSKVPPGQIIELSNNLFLYISGMGAQQAEIAARSLINRGVGALISWGTAGGLASTTRPGQLVIPERVLDDQGREFAVDGEWLKPLSKGLLSTQIIHGNLLQVRQIVAAAADKQRLLHQYQAVAVDMESAAIAAVAQAAGVHCRVIRVIADAVDCEFPLWLQQSLTMTGEIRILSLLSQVLRRPTRLKDLYHLSRALTAAKSTLQAVAQPLLMHQGYRP